MYMYISKNSVNYCRVEKIKCTHSNWIKFISAVWNDFLIKKNMREVLFLKCDIILYKDKNKIVSKKFIYINWHNFFRCNLSFSSFTNKGVFHVYVLNVGIRVAFWRFQMFYFFFLHWLWRHNGDEYRID